MTRGKYLFLGLILCLLLPGCGSSEARKVFTQAEKDLTLGSYSYALSGYLASAGAGYDPIRSYRGAGIASLRLGEDEEAADYFTQAMAQEKVGKGMQRDLLCYRITARINLGQYQEAREDCQRLSSLGVLDADGYFLYGQVALGQDFYDEARTNFETSFEADPTYDRAIQIYDVYVKKGLEADGTYFLELSLNKDPSSAEEYCDCGRVYYYMEDYDHARDELIMAQKKGSKEAILLLGMVYMGKGDYSNARAMYTQYLTQVEESGRGYNGIAMCEIAQGNYNEAREVINQGIPHATTEELQALLFNEVVTYEKEYDFASACAKAEEYMQTFPGDEQMQRELTFLRSRVAQ